MNWPIHRPSRARLRSREAGTDVQPRMQVVGLDVAPRGPALNPAEYDEIGGQAGTAVVPVPREAEHPQQHLPPYALEKAPHPNTRSDSSESQRVNTSAGSRIFPRNWPSVTIANQTVYLPWWYPISHLLVQNNSASPLYCDFDAQATPGSLVVAAASVLALDVKVYNTLTVYSTGTFNINGATTGGIYVAGWV